MVFPWRKSPEFARPIPQLGRWDMHRLARLHPNGYISDEASMMRQTSTCVSQAVVPKASKLDKKLMPVLEKKFVLDNFGEDWEDDPMTRQTSIKTVSTVASEETFEAPAELHSAFDPFTEVQPRDTKRFQKVKTVADADRNRGVVNLMWDTVERKYVISKLMPNWWIGNCHAEFVQNHPGETELPWQDIGCIKFLNSIGYPYGVTLLGVYRDDTRTEVITTFATEGDFFMWCSRPESPPPGLGREELVRPLLKQLFHAVKQLHDLGIVHRDISLENALVSKAVHEDSYHLLLIDHGMSLTGRFVADSRAKRWYRAPEVHEDGDYDGFAADSFSVGVVMWCALVNDYPWLSTTPGADECFEYYRKFGFKSFINKRALRNSTTKISEVMSEPVQELLEGLLQVNPNDRLTLGEAGACFNDGKSPTSRFHEKRSVWGEEWMQFEQPGWCNF